MEEGKEPTAALPPTQARLLLVLDFCFTQTVVNLLSTSAWRGVWNLWDLYLYGGIDLGLDNVGLFQDEGYTDCAFGCSIGTAFLVMSFVFSPAVERGLAGLPTWSFLIVSRGLTIGFFIVYMLMWRSYYNLGYLLLTTDARIIAAFAASTLLLVALGGYSTVIGVPVYVEIDPGPGYSQLWTRNPGGATFSLHRWGDGLLSAFMEILGVICWFGTYEYIVKFLPSGDEVSLLMHSLWPLICGLGTGIIALLLQGLLVAYTSAGEKETDKPVCTVRIFRTLLTVLGMLSSVFHWYGTWTLIDSFFMPDQWEISNYISAVLGFAGLCLLGTSKCLQGGVGRDWDQSPLIVPHYFSAWLLWWRSPRHLPST